MDERTLRVLEFDKVRHRLRQMVTYPPAGERVESLFPQTEREAVERLQEETQQAGHILDAGIDGYLGHLADIRPLLKRVALDAMLEEEELAAVAETERKPFWNNQYASALGTRPRYSTSSQPCGVWMGTMPTARLMTTSRSVPAPKLTTVTCKG